VFSPPDGSRITTDLEDGYRKIVIPQKSGGVRRWFAGISLSFFVGAWAIVMVQFSGSLGYSRPSVFGILWLILWALAGVTQIWTLYRVFRPAVPETLVLAKHEILYDSGVAPLQFPFSPRSQSEYWEKMFQRRIRMSFGPAQLKTLRLRDFEAETRLTVDIGSKRFDIATGANEPEREWLFGILCKFYNLSPEQKTTRVESNSTDVVNRLSRRASRERAKRGTQQCPYCHTPTRIETEGDQKWQVCDECGWNRLVEG
jgi:hypothetical protein